MGGLGRRPGKHGRNGRNVQLFKLADCYIGRSSTWQQAEKCEVPIDALVLS
jgi:hypothetical protein